MKKHVLMPEIVKLSDKEKSELLEKYSITTKELPKMLLSDSSIEGMDIKEEDVVKILRKSLTSNEAVYYRCIING